MSTSALQVVQSAYAAFGRGDVPALLAAMSDDVEWKFVGTQGLPYTGSFRGKEQVAKWFASIPTVDDILAFEPREFVSDGEQVAVLGWERSKSVPRGKTIETEWAHFFTVRNGRVVRFWGIYDTEASAAARA